MSAVLGFVSGTAVGGLMSVVLEPIFREIVYALNSQFQNLELREVELINMNYQGIIDDDTYFERMAKLGYSRDNALRLLNVSKANLTVLELADLRRRELIDEDTYKNELRRIGVTEDRRIIFENATKVFPSISDIIRFSVREAFTPEVVSKFGYDQDLPEQFLNEARKLGLDDNYARAYWFAHWELPSLTMGFEMFHRGIISRDELRLLMRVLDIPSFWRERLEQLSFNIPTRVDIRRMFRLGVVTREEVKQNYIKLGYSEDDAERLTRFTEVSEVRDDRELAKSEIKKLLEINEINDIKALELLRRIGYGEDNAEYLLALWKYNIRKDKLDDDIKYYSDLYKNGVIDLEQFNNALSTLNIKDNHRKLVLAKVQRLRKVDNKLPSKEDIVRAFKSNLINEDELRRWLVRLNYTEDSIELIISLAKLQT